MFGEDSLKEVCKIFIGDIKGFYTYKSGSKLVKFVNENFNCDDVYGSGFPSRGQYIFDKFFGSDSINLANRFFSLILNKDYLKKELNISDVQAAEMSNQILSKFNEILDKDSYKITKNGNIFKLVRESDDLMLLGSGGFAHVYKQKSTGLAIKKLKEDFLTDRNIVSRFKREFNITKKLQDKFGIIKVYNFDESNCSYTMELAEQTLENYVSKNELNDEIKLKLIRQILYIISEIHQMDILHRDLSPNNIFIINGQVKIADFGLGKDLKVFTSHQTIHSQAMGQYMYCAPEQFMMLKEGSKSSDIYSIGSILNFIMTRNPSNSHHKFRAISEKSRNENPTYRYLDATEMYVCFEKQVKYNENTENQKIIEVKIIKREHDDTVESYIYTLTSKEIVKYILSGKDGFKEALIYFMNKSTKNAQHIMESIDSDYKNICTRFVDYDCFAGFSKLIILGEYNYIAKEIAAKIISDIAWRANRFNVQDMVKEIIEIGIEPSLEDIINF